MRLLYTAMLNWFQEVDKVRFEVEIPFNGNADQSAPMSYLDSLLSGATDLGITGYGASKSKSNYGELITDIFII